MPPTRSRTPPQRPAPSAPLVRRRRGPSPQKTELTRSEILNAALAEFLEAGIAKATMDKIAQRAKLAKGTLYLHFGSKEALLQGALDATISASALSSFQMPRKSGERVRDYVQRLVLPSMENFHASGRAQLARLVLAEARTYPALANFYREHMFDPWLQHFERLFQQAQEEGELHGIAPAVAAKLLGAPFWLVLAQDSLQDRSTPVAGWSAAELTRVQIDVIFGLHAQAVAVRAPKKSGRVATGSAAAVPKP
jgi:TetR/AcrR family transcriptional regulator of autoinduction and epiphytic fitness